ncbi:unnamed protein product [Anisakis simplex]|uniref:Pre-mRNA 3' end processing protein WDR33 (inferred by orthology to a human protein) n=1 Tax=Anisakis simplex TaxID=6269 RepID=A0A0M3JUK9_ANISI|nr:unnamed protein product [Anisakis simplex]
MTAIAQPVRFTSPSTVSMATITPGTSSNLQTPQSAAASHLQALAQQQFQPYYLRPAYRFKVNAQPTIGDMITDGPGRRLRKNVANVRRHIDYVANVLSHIEARLWQYGVRDRSALQPDVLYQNSALPPLSTIDKPVDCVLTKFVRAAMNKVKCPIYSICWTPEGKRLITGASTGEFTLWNGTAFNFETILQAHDSAIRALKWSHNDQWLVSADHDGFVKYWQPNMNNVHMYQAHNDEPIRSLRHHIKLVTGSDDGTARVWDFARCAEERVFRGHGSDVRSVDWHPQKGLICTGSRDSQQPVKLWDPKTGQCLATLHDHKNSVTAVQWNRNGNWLLTGSRDHLIKVYDIRMMREMHSYRGHKKEVTALAWHPVHESLFVSGGGDGSMAYWLVNNEKELSFMEHAHDQAIWSLEWHPLGHILASGSNDNNTKFWARNRPGDTQDDIFGLSSSTGIPMHMLPKETDTDSEQSALSIIPGLYYIPHNSFIYANTPMTNSTPLAGPLLFPDDPNARQQATNIGAKKTLIKQPPPKKAQRQFERMWNVAKPAVGAAVGNDDVEEEVPDESSFRRPKTSLLGPPPQSASSTSKCESTQQAQHSASSVPSSSVDKRVSDESLTTVVNSPPVSSSYGHHPSQAMPITTPPSIAQLHVAAAVAAAQSSINPLLNPPPSIIPVPPPGSLLPPIPMPPWSSTSQAHTQPSQPTTTNSSPKPPPIIQQVNNAPQISVATTQSRHHPPIITQEMIPPTMGMSISTSQMQQIAASLPFPQPPGPGPLLWPPPIVAFPLPQNLDIDYRMGASSSLMMPPRAVSTAAAHDSSSSATTSSDVDLRTKQQQQTSSYSSTSSSTITSQSSQSWRNPNKTTHLSPSPSDVAGTSARMMHDPRIRHEANLAGSLQRAHDESPPSRLRTNETDRDADQQQAGKQQQHASLPTSISAAPIRDPRKRPQSSTSTPSQQMLPKRVSFDFQEGDYDGRFESTGAKSMKRAWMPDMGEKRSGYGMSSDGGGGAGSRAGSSAIAGDRNASATQHSVSRATNGSGGTEFSNFEDRAPLGHIPYQHYSNSGSGTGGSGGVGGAPGSAPMRRSGPLIDRARGTRGRGRRGGY